MATSPASSRDWVVRLLAPMLDDDSVALVKALSHRPTQMGGGGRTTELVARPLMSLYYPELTGLHQPLAGEYAGRRTVLEQLPFVQGWGVEIAMLIDVARRYGAEAIAPDRPGHPRASPSFAARAVGAGGGGDGHDAGPRSRRKPAGRSFPPLRRADGSVVPLNLSERPPLAWLTG